MGAGRTTTGTVIGGLLAMYGSTIPVGTSSQDDMQGVVLGDGTAVNETEGGLMTPAKALLASAPSTSNLEELSHDIIREELAGDSPRHSGACAFVCKAMCIALWVLSRRLQGLLHE